MTANWQRAGLLSIGGIPNRTTICATVSPIGGGSDDSGAINSAISTCPAGEVVSLTAGTFTIAEGNSVQLNRGVTLRGAGGGQTILQRTNGATLNSYQPGSNPSPIVVEGTTNDPGNKTTALTADGAQGSNTVTVASAAGFAVGQVVWIDELSGASWQPERNPAWVAAGYTQVWASPDYRVQYQAHNPYYQYVDDFNIPANGPPGVGTLACDFSNCDRVTNELHQITAINGNTVTFDDPLMISYRVSHTAQLYNWSQPLVQQAGLENLTMSSGDQGDLHIENCAYCWAQNVEATLFLNPGIQFISAYRPQLEGVYVHNPVWPVPGGAGYNIDLEWGTTEALIENSISVLGNKVMTARAAGAGSVIAYNYMDDAYDNGQDTNVEIGLNGSHFVGSHHILFEGNQSFNLDSDATHGNSIYHTFFRNYASGFRRTFTALDGTVVNDAANCCGPLRAATAHEYSYWFSYLGNVLGTSGAMSGWSLNSTASANTYPGKAIYTFGYADISPQGSDPNVAGTALVDGNYDYVQNAITWAASDTAHTLPNSLYLTSKPAFFTGQSSVWPPVDPINGVVHSIPAAARYAAGTPFVQP